VVFPLLRFSEAFLSVRLFSYILLRTLSPYSPPFYFHGNTKQTSLFTVREACWFFHEVVSVNAVVRSRREEGREGEEMEGGEEGGEKQDGDGRGKGGVCDDPYNPRKRAMKNNAHCRFVVRSTGNKSKTQCEMGHARLFGLPLKQREGGPSLSTAFPSLTF